MFDSFLKKYSCKDHFFVTPTTKLKDVCNAPDGKFGVFYYYLLIRGKIKFVYIGYAKNELNDSTKSNLKNSGLKEALINGKQFGDKRSISLLQKLLIDGADAIDVYWYVTQDHNHNDDPEKLVKKMLQDYKKMYGTLPEWNNL